MGHGRRRQRGASSWESGWDRSSPIRAAGTRLRRARRRTTTSCGPSAPRGVLREPVYDGTHFRYRDFIVEPSGLPRPVEIWVGGRTRRSLRRAIALGDAWIPFRLLVDDFRDLFADTEIRDLMAAWATPLQMVLAPSHPSTLRVTLRARPPSCAPWWRWVPPASACAFATIPAPTTWSRWRPCSRWCGRSDARARLGRRQAVATTEAGPRTSSDRAWMTGPRQSGSGS